MNKLVATSLLLLAIYVVPVPAAICYGFNGDQWYCSFSCCYDFTDCCYTAGSYWYAWALVSLFFLLCFCACAGCGGYGYRRYYVVRRVQYPPPATATVVTTTAQQGGYQQFTNQYQPYSGPKGAPPPYNPNPNVGKY